MKEKIKLQSAKLLLDIARKEYEYNENRLQALYRRTGVAMMAVGVYLAALWKLIPTIDGKFVLFSDGLGSLGIPGFFYLLSLIFGLVALFFLFRALLVGECRFLDSNKGFDEESARVKERKTAFRFVQAYQEISIVNERVLEKRRKNYEKAIMIWILSIIELLIYLFTTLI